MNAFNWTIALGMLLSVLLCQGCNATKEEKHVDIKLTNSTSEEINKTEVLFGKNPCGAGIMGPGGSAIHVYFAKPITATARVKWVDSKGHHQERIVDVGKVYDLKQPGELAFEIGNGGVTARFTPFK